MLPGNAFCGDKSAAGFHLCASVAAAAICQPGQKLGVRVLAAISAAASSADTLSCLGSALLCAPLVCAAESTLRATAGSLRLTLREVLDEADQTDSANIQAAIQLAMPVRHFPPPFAEIMAAPTLGLIGAMQMLASRDWIARQYITGFEDILIFGLPLLTHHGVNPLAVTKLYLTWLARAPDSHLTRACDPVMAQIVAAEARQLLTDWNSAHDNGALYERLLDWDVRLKSAGWNLRTSADLTLATLFAWRLCNPRAHVAEPVVKEHLQTH